MNPKSATLNPEPHVSEPHVRVSTLENGFRVITDTMSTVETVSVGAWVQVGTRHEQAADNGVSHFLEHMAFKGTRKRDARAIAEEIEAVGGHLNAYTSREFTAYYAKVLKDDLPIAVDIIADILQHSVMDPEELARERTVILQEIHQANDTPEDVVFDLFQETAFPDHAIGRPILGAPDLVRDMPRDTLIRYMGDHYSPRRTVLAAAGHVDHDRLVEMARDAFMNLPDHKDGASDPVSYAGGDRREARDLEQVQVLLGFEGIPYKDPDFYAASVFSTLFGGGMSSRLFQEIREKRGLVYSVYSYLSCYADTGLFGIHAGTGADELAELMPLMCDEIAKVREKVSDDEVNRARAQLKASMLMSLESTSSRCEQRARQLLVYGRPLSVAEVVARVNDVDRAAVRRVAERLTAGTPIVSALGPIGRLDDFGPIADRLA